jgi:hypothetical protein
MSDRIGSALELTIFNFISASSGVTTIWDKQSTDLDGFIDKPALPFVLMDITSGPALEGRPTFKHKIIDTYTYSFKWKFSLTIDVFAQTLHMAIANKIIQGLALPTKRAILNAGNIASRTNTEPIDLTELVNNNFEQRSQFSIDMAYNEDVDDVTGEIQTVIVNGTVDNINFTKIIS